MAAAEDGLDALLQFAALLLRSGGTATRTQMLVRTLAGKMGPDPLSIGISFDSVIASTRRAGRHVTALREVGPPAVNASRIMALEELVTTLGPGSSPRMISDGVARIERSGRLYSGAAIAASVSAASGGFAFLNGAAPTAMIAAALAGGIGQYSRLQLSHRQVNHYASAALSAIVASALYHLATHAMTRLGQDSPDNGGGFIASVLFLIPGVPLISGLFDLLQVQTVAALSRLAYGLTVLLAAALGLGIVVALFQVDMSRGPPMPIAYPLALTLRAVASFVASAAFAMLFNSPRRVMLAAGLLAVVANGIRLVLGDAGFAPALGTFVAAFVIGIAGVAVERRFALPAVVTMIAPMVIMMPGVAAFETIVLFDHGQTIEALQALVSCGFLVGALALGLATALVLRTGAGPKPGNA
jgi:uncharacterized membrane protein YjjB (DUF3815 family)